MSGAADTRFINSRKGTRLRKHANNVCCALRHRKYGYLMENWMKIEYFHSQQKKKTMDRV
jgi:hypothetical protein